MGLRMWCACGHSQEEHGGDDDFPGSTMCVFNPEHSDHDNRTPGKDCDCLAYEHDKGKGA